MNSIVQQQFPVLESTYAIRHALMDTLTDDDLSFAVEGNPTLGELCKAIADIEHSYIESFKTNSFSYTYSHPTDRTHSVKALKALYAEQEAAMKQAISALPEEALYGTIIDRGYGFTLPVMAQFSVYREALLIFYAKAIVYLRAMGKPIPEQMAMWIG